MQDSTINTKPITDAFDNIEPPNMRGDYEKGYYLGQDRQQQKVLDQIDKLEVGKGAQSVKIDEQGISIGGRTFETSRLRIYMNGTQIYNDGKNDRILIGKNPNL